MEYYRDDLPGGAEVQVLALAREFARSGHEVAYVCQRYDPHKPVASRVDGVLVLRVLRWRRVFRWLAGPEILRTVRHLHPDVVYHRGASPFAGFAALAARVVGAPFVWGCAEDNMLERGVLSRRDRGVGRQKGRHLRVLALNCNGMLSQALFVMGLRMARTIIVQTNLQRKLLQHNYRRGCAVVPNGVELGEQSVERSATPMVLWLNNVMRRKRPEVFIELARALSSRHPDAQFVMVGGRADDDYLHDLQRLGRDVPGLVMHGAVPFSETGEWFGRAWVYVLTSESEGFPNVMLQAWAAGTPVVSLSIDPDGLLRDQGLGRVSGSLEALKTDVDHMLGDASLRDSVGRLGRAYVSERLQFEMVAGHYLDVFAQAVGETQE
jgi:glycosyltransferase involved in cell wall biosynthesis